MTPTAKAMSVAMGTPQPIPVAPPLATDRYRPAGTSIPPSAAAKGKAARRHSESSPWCSSPLISRPTTKKKTTMRPSLTNQSSDRSKENVPTRTPSVVCHRLV